MVNWAMRQRQQFISDHLNAYGWVGRKPLMDQFGISTQQASSDLQAYQRANPGIMEYNESAKRYEKCGGRSQGRMASRANQLLREENNKLRADNEQLKEELSQSLERGKDVALLWGDLQKQNRAIREALEAFLIEPRRSPVLINKKSNQFTPMTITVTRGQVLAAIAALQGDSDAQVNTTELVEDHGDGSATMRVNGVEVVLHSISDLLKEMG